MNKTYRIKEVSRGFRAMSWLLRIIFTCFTVKDWHGQENLPTKGGFIVVSNHITYADPLTLAHYLYNSGYPPRFLAKSTLFSTPVIKWIVKSLDQIPVHRGTSKARDAVDSGVAYLERGDMIAMFPEGTLTREPNLWPMEARTGAARMALSTGVPMIPVVQWGAQRLLGNYSKVPHLFPRKKVSLVAGPAIDFSDLRGKELNNEVLRLATDRIMDTLTAMLEELRGEKAPAMRYSMRKKTV